MPVRSSLKPAPTADQLGPETEIDLDRIGGIDPLNSRKIDPADIDRMAAMLRADGQINPIVVRPGGDGKLLVLCGARRWRAFERLAAEGWEGAIHARIFTGEDAEARALSIAENIGREDLHPLDEAEAIAALALTRSVTQIARQFGFSEPQVRGKIALATKLSDRVKVAWREGKFGEGRFALKIARAFTAAKDHAAMDAVLDAPDAGVLLRDPLALQKRLLARAVPATAASARFVTVEAYEAAGGTLATQDLFVDETMLTDPDLLERLKNEKLARCADAIRRDEGWGVLVDPDLASSLRREKSDFLAEEMERLREIDDRLGAEGLDSSTWRRLDDERAGIQRLAALRAVKRSERHRFGLAVTLDDDGLFVVRALILPQRENQIDVPAAGAQSPLAAAEAGAPPLAGSPSAALTLAADGTISAEEHDWGDASGLSDAAFAAAAARAAGARIPNLPSDDDAPCPSPHAAFARPPKPKRSPT